MIRDEGIAALMGALGAALVLGALGFQYLVHLAPCEMCHWQRWPLIAAAIIGFTASLHSRFIAPLAILIVAVGGVLIAHQPQNLALFLVAALIVVAFSWWKPNPALVAILLVALSGLIGLYQTGMQYHLLPGPQACTAARYVLGSNAPPPEVRCDVPTWFFLGLALPAWNAIISLGGAAVGAVLLTRRGA